MLCYLDVLTTTICITSQLELPSDRSFPQFKLLPINQGTRACPNTTMTIVIQSSSTTTNTTRTQTMRGQRRGMIEIAGRPGQKGETKTPNQIQPSRLVSRTWAPIIVKNRENRKKSISRKRRDNGDNDPRVEEHLVMPRHFSFSPLPAAG